MKKFFVAAAASLLIFGSQAEASTVDNLDVQIEQTQEVGHWADFRDEVLLDRESDRERRKRKERERRERERWERERWERERRRRTPPPPVYVPPPPRPGYGAPPPPAPRPGYGAPPPAPVPRPGLPPPPPTRRR